MWEQGQLAVVQGVGYPNPDRSHFESMDIWQSADPEGRVTTGWLGRAAVESGRPLGRRADPAHRPRAACRWPLTGAPGGGAVTVNDQNSFRLELGGGEAAQQKARRRLLDELATPTGKAGEDDLVSFVQRRQVQTLTAVETAARAARGTRTPCRGRAAASTQKLQLDRRPDRQGLRHAHLLRQPRRLRHPRRPGPRAQQPAGRAGRLGRRLLPDVEDHRPRPPGAADDLLGVRPPRAGERQPGHRPRRRLVPVRGRAVGQGRRRRQAPQPGGPRRRRPEVPHRLPPASTPRCSTTGWAATARPSWARSGTTSRHSSPGPEESRLAKPAPHLSAAVHGLPSRSRSHRRERKGASPDFTTS